MPTYRFLLLFIYFFLQFSKFSCFCVWSCWCSRAITVKALDGLQEIITAVAVLFCKGFNSEQEITFLLLGKITGILQVKIIVAVQLKSQTPRSERHQRCTCVGICDPLIHANEMGSQCMYLWQKIKMKSAFRHLFGSA